MSARLFLLSLGAMRCRSSNSAIRCTGLEHLARTRRVNFFLSFPHLIPSCPSSPSSPSSSSTSTTAISAPLALLTTAIPTLLNGSLPYSSLLLSLPPCHCSCRRSHHSKRRSSSGLLAC
ncbi:hypothetical protein BKA70DRAFT_1356785 [Coprinopsis sp. MPI-PUGE-AT-0042]|nr:hypothetical protein BKA70DRAFT_1356785 [Coprinopsis sp. MPI-PUGE-AT-0042]